MRALNFFIFVSFFYSTSSFSCPNGYIQIPNEHKCVYAQNNSQYYPRAVRECNKLGGDVVKIENIFENSILFGLLGEYFNEAAAYIGVEKLPNGTWVYSDGARLTYTNWAPGQPTSTINATICAIIDPQTAQWRAAECSIARPFYCQIDGNQAECDPGWVYFDKTDSCYYLHNFTLQDGFHWQLYSWDDAEGNCRQMNSHLISIHTTDEDEFVYDLVHTTFPADPNPDPAPTDQNFEVYNWVWIGLNAQGIVGKDYWIDATLLDYFGNWTFSLPESIQPWAIRNDPFMPVAPRNWAWLWRNAPRFICKKAPGK